MPTRTFTVNGNRVEIPVPNKGLAAVLMSPATKKTMGTVGNDARTIFVAKAPKRTGDLAESTVSSVGISNKAKGMPRWEAVIEVRVPYGVWNQTGAGPGMHPRSTGNRPIFGPFEGAYTFSEVVRIMGGT